MNVTVNGSVVNPDNNVVDDNNAAPRMMDAGAGAGVPTKFLMDREVLVRTMMASDIPADIKEKLLSYYEIDKATMAAVMAILGNDALPESAKSAGIYHHLTLGIQTREVFESLLGSDIMKIVQKIIALAPKVKHVVKVAGHRAEHVVKVTPEKVERVATVAIPHAADIAADRAKHAADVAPEKVERVVTVAVPHAAEEAGRRAKHVGKKIGKKFKKW